MSEQLALAVEPAAGLVYREGYGYVCPNCRCELTVDGARCPVCAGNPFYGLDANTQRSEAATTVSKTLEEAA